MWKRFSSSNELASGPPPKVSDLSAGNAHDTVLNTIALQNKTIGDLDKRIAHLEITVTKERNLAKQFLNASQVSTTHDKISNQNKAKKHLTKAKRLQNDISKYEGMRSNLETLQNALESAAVAKTVQTALVDGTKTLDHVTRDHLDPDKIQDIVDQLENHTESLTEATILLSQEIGSDPQVEFEVEEEMEEIEREIQQEILLKSTQMKKKKAPPVPSSFPELPLASVTVAGPEDEAEDNIRVKVLL